MSADIRLALWQAGSAVVRRRMRAKTFAVHEFVVAPEADFAEDSFAVDRLSRSAWKIVGAHKSGGMRPYAFAFSADAWSMHQARAFLKKHSAGSTKKMRGKTIQFSLRYKTEEDKDSPAELPTVTFKRVMVFKQGIWKGKVWGNREFDEIQRASDEAHSLIRPPFKFDHTMQGPAIGWVGKLDRPKDEEFFADIGNVPVEVETQIRAGQWTSMSPELDPNFEVEDKGDIYDWAFTGLALLGADPPAIMSLPPLVNLATFSRSESDMVCPYDIRPEDFLDTEIPGIDGATIVLSAGGAEPEAGDEPTSDDAAGDHSHEEDSSMTDAEKKALADQEKANTDEATRLEGEDDRLKTGLDDLAKQKVQMHKAKVTQGLAMMGTAKKLKPADVEDTRDEAMALDNIEEVEYTCKVTGSKMMGTAVDRYFNRRLAEPDVELPPTGDAGTPEGTPPNDPAKDDEDPSKVILDKAKEIRAEAHKVGDDITEDESIMQAGRELKDSKVMGRYRDQHYTERDRSSSGAKNRITLGAQTE